MIIDVTIRHRAETRVRGKAKPRWYLAQVPVEIVDAVPVEAPVAAWWAAPGGKARVAVRGHGGHLWQPVLVGETLVIKNGRGEKVESELVATDDGQCVAKAGRNQVQALSAEGIVKFLTESLSARTDDNWRFDEDTGRVLAEDRSVRETLWSDLDERVVGMHRAAARYACFGGVAHRRISHPMIEYDPTHWGQMHTVTADECKDPGRSYPIARHKEAVKRFMSESQGRVDKRSLKWLEPEIVDASLLDFDMPRWMARTIATRCVRSLSKDSNGMANGSSASYLSRDGMRAFFHLREAVASDEPTEVLYDRLRDMDDASGLRGLLDHHHRTCETVMERLKAEIDAVADARPAAPGPRF